MNRLLTTEDVAEQIRSTPRTVRDYARAGRLVGSYVGRRWLFTEAAVADFVDSASNRTIRPRRRRAS